MKIAWHLSWLLWVGLQLGCTSGESTADPSADPSDGTPNSADQAATQPAEVSMEVKSWDEVQQWIAAHKGQVVVVDVWSTMCLPCMKEFPNFVAMHQRLGDQVACASLSVDYYGGEGGVTSDIKDRVRQFLEGQSSTMDNFVCSDPDETVLANLNAVSIPISLVYGRDGKLHRMFTEGLGSEQSGGFSYQKDVEPLVTELLADGE